MNHRRFSAIPSGLLACVLYAGGFFLISVVGWRLLLSTPAHAVNPSEAGSQARMAPMCTSSTIVTSNSNSGIGSLRQAINDTCESGTITFNGDMTIDLLSTLNITKGLTIDGETHAITLSAGLLAGVVSVDASTPVILDHLTITNGKATHGAGIYNWKHLSLIDSTIINNQGTGTNQRGGGIYNNGTLTVTQSLFSGNMSGRGGAIYNNNIDDAITISDSTIISNTATTAGGGIANNSGRLRASNITLAYNSSPSGGGLDVFAGDVSVTNSTISHNTSIGSGGGVAINGGQNTLIHVTINANSAPFAGGIYQAATLKLHNSIIANSTGGDCESNGASFTNINSLIEDASCLYTFSGDPLLMPLDDYGGDTATHALYPNSIAHGNGDSAVCSGDPINGLDQRGMPRSSICDLGAFESQGLTLSSVSGDNQSTMISTAFDDPLVVSVASNDGFELSGMPITVTFDGPVSGPSINPVSLDASTLTATASVTPTANTIYGSYVVTATVGNDTTTFNLHNCTNASLTVTSANNSGAGSLRQAIFDACGGNTIGFNQDYTIALQSRLDINKTLHINGTGYDVTLSGDTDASGSPDVQMFSIPSGGDLTLSNLNLTHGFGTNGGAIQVVGGRLVVDSSTISHSRAGLSGGAVFSGDSGTIVISNTTFLSNTGGINGGALYLELGASRITNSTFAYNSSPNGGAINILADNTVVKNSTLAYNNSPNGAAVFRAGGAVSLINALMAYNDSGADCVGIEDSTTSLIEDGSCGASVSGDPYLAPLGAYGGANQTFALLPGSAAIDAATSALCPSHDQRGITRPAACDIGAFESQGFTIAVTSGNNQSTIAGTAFSNPLVVQVTANNVNESVGPGGSITFSGPANGASIDPATLTGTTTANGASSVSVTANATAGSYTVTATARGISTPVTFSLSQTGQHIIFVPYLAKYPQVLKVSR